MPNEVARFATEQIAPEKTGRQKEAAFQSGTVHFWVFDTSSPWQVVKCSWPDTPMGPNLHD